MQAMGERIKVVVDVGDEVVLFRCFMYAFGIHKTTSHAQELAKGPHMATAPPGKPATPGSHRGGSGKRAGKAKQPGTPPKRATSKGFGA